MTAGSTPAATWVARVMSGEPVQLEWAAIEQHSALVASTPAQSMLFDGGLYNGAELARSLGVDRPARDANLLGPVYARWGEAMLPRLRGEFVLALSDIERASAFLARDPTGCYPLYYAQAGDGLLFSTGVDALFEHSSISRDVSALALAEFVWQRLPRLGETCFESVHRLAPGHVLRIQAGGISVSRYWEPEGDPVTGDEALEEFSSLVEQAVARAAHGRRPGILLSGGIDSAVVAAAAAARWKGAPAPVAVSLDAPAHPNSEREQQRHLASTLSLVHCTRRFDDLIATDEIRLGALEWSRKMSRPVADPFMPNHVALIRAARAEGAEVMLSGHGGDEWLGVSRFHAADCLRRLDLVGLYRFWLARRYWFGGSALKSTVWTSGMRPLLRPLRSRRQAPQLPSWLAPDPGIATELRSREAERLSSWPASDADERRAGLDDPLLALLQEALFEESGLLGIEVRMPLLDADLVDFLYRTPPEVLLLGNRMKGLARAYLASRLGPAGLPDLRCVTAPGLWEAFVQQEAERLTTRVGALTRLSELGVVHRRFTSSEMAPRVLLREVGAAAYWHLLSAETWLRKWG